jgi:ribosomal protein S27E
MQNVELLAALVIGMLVAIPLIALVQMMGRTWRVVTITETLNMATELVDEALQKRFQNMQDIAYDTTSGQLGTALVGHDANGDTIEIAVQQPAGGPAVVVIQDLTTGTTVTLQAPGVTYAGTTFSVNGRVVTCNICATSLLDASRRAQQSATFVIQGGV